MSIEKLPIELVKEIDNVAWSFAHAYDRIGTTRFYEDLKHYMLDLVRTDGRICYTKTCHAKPHLNMSIGDDFLKPNGFDCSECGGSLDLPVKAYYCPNCGARVVKVDA